MWTSRSALVALLCCCVLTMLGCRGEIEEIAIDISPLHGCAPLQVQFVGKAVTRADITGTFSWTIGKATHLSGPQVTHTFETPGKYHIALTVTGEQQTKTRATTVEVGKAELPRLPGLYLQQGCSYRALKEVEEQKFVKQLGKTSLEDLEQRIVGRKLSTPELVTHPLWRREHTHTFYLVDRGQFVDVPLAPFQAYGFVVVGEDVGEVTLFRILPGPETAWPSQVVTRVVDSWELENLSPAAHALRRTRMAAQAHRYVPQEQLQAGLYFIAIKGQDKAMPGLRPIALVASHN